MIFDTIDNIRPNIAQKHLTENGLFISTELNLSIFLRSVFKSQTFKTLSVTPNGQKLEAVKAFLEDSGLQPHIDRVYDLEQLAEAHIYSETRRTKGKIAIRVWDR